MRSARVVAVITATLLTVSVLTACTGGDEPDADPTPSARTTPLAEVDTGTVTVARDDFCQQVAPAAVEAALGSAPAGAQTWSNGERARLAPGVTDVAHEYGCAWSASGTTARAWVFAPPVTAVEAEALRRAASRVAGCEPVPGAPRFGTHDAALRCTGGDGAASGNGVETTFHGLFGDAWLSCSLRTPGPGPDELDRAAQWCATVLAAATA